jgi:hypothetical protein
MKRLLLFAALLGAVTAMTAGSASAAPTQSAQYFLGFNSANDTFTFDVEKLDDNGAGNLTVDTMDCCIEGDHWTVSFDTAQPANPANDVSGTGNGSISVFSGAATSHPFIRGSVTVSYASGVDIFPAGMCVRFSYTKAPGVEITPPAGAQPGC